jgi:PAS domain S-box-containing protein
MYTIASHVSPPADAGDSLLKALVEASPLAIYMLDGSGLVQLWNPAAERIFGWKESDVLGLPDPTVAGDKRAVDELIAHVVAADGPVEREVARYSRALERIEVSISATRVTNVAGGVHGVMVIAADITERRRIERERDRLLAWEREARARAEAAEKRSRFLAESNALLDQSLDYLATLNNIARLTVPVLADYCLIDEVENDCMSRVALAHVNPEREKKLHRQVRQPLASDPGMHPVVRVIQTGKSVLVEEADDAVLREISHSDEHLQRLRELGLHSFMVVPIEAHGKVLGAITLAYAESRRRYTVEDLATAEELARRAAAAVDAARMYRESRLAVQARERLLAIVSHDLRNSLATVLLNSSAILESDSSVRLEQHVRDQLVWISRSAEQMNRLISDLLDVSAIELGRFSLDPSPQSVSTLIGDATQMYRPLAAERGIMIESSLADDLPPVMADPGRLQQVLGNLVTNAVKFSSAGSTIAIRAERDGPGEIRFSVADTGTGIEPDQLASIFEGYWRGRRGRRGGAGLGLGIAKAIVDGHGGRIWVTSTVGEGSTFAFTIPVAGTAEDSDANV